MGQKSRNDEQQYELLLKVRRTKRINIESVPADHDTLTNDRVSSTTKGQLSRYSRRVYNGMSSATEFYMAVRYGTSAVGRSVGLSNKTRCSEHDVVCTTPHDAVSFSDNNSF